MEMTTRENLCGWISPSEWGLTNGEVSAIIYGLSYRNGVWRSPVERVLWVSDPKTIENRFWERWSQSKENWKQMHLRAIRLCDASGRTKHAETREKQKSKKFNGVWRSPVARDVWERAGGFSP